MMPRWFRFHLSTAVVLMFAAGGLMYANVRLHVGEPTAFGNEQWLCRIGYGFPIAACYEDTEFFRYAADRVGAIARRNESSLKLSALGHQQIDGSISSGYFSYDRGNFAWRPTGIFVDFLFALTVLFFVALISESLIRRSNAMSLKQPETRN